MLLVKTDVKKSKIKGAGLGLFAAEFIPKGKRIWEFTVGIDRIVTQKEVNKLGPHEKEFIHKYAYKYPLEELWILCVDNDRFINHSEDPNTKDSNEDLEEGYSVAARDIDIGEELTCDYREFDAHFNEKIAKN